MEMINIEELYRKDKKIISVTAELPENVGKFILEMFDNAYYYGLQGLSIEEVIGSLIIAGICITVPEEKWMSIIPLYQEEPVNKLD